MASSVSAASAAPAEHPTIRVGTRSSKLALVQARAVVAALEATNPGVRFVIDARESAGDRDKTTPLPNLGKGLWTSEFEARLVGGELDLVVHSAKDMPTTLPAGCCLGGTMAREDPRDAAVFPPGSAYRVLADLPPASVVGTSSLRRAAQLRRRFPGLVFRDVRGNVETRLRKLDEPHALGTPADPDAVRYDCIILAAAGLRRMGFEARIAQLLDGATTGTLYAVGQGALGIEVRDGDDTVLRLLQPILHTPTMLALLAERALMRTLEGGCSVPIGVETSWVPDDARSLRLRATVVSVDGQQAVDADLTAVATTPEEADALGVAAAQTMVEQGAQAILDEINKNRVIVEPVEAPTTASA